MSQCRLASEYRVSQPTIGQIVHGDTWRHVPGPNTDDVSDMDIETMRAWATELCGSNPMHQESIVFVLAAIGWRAEPADIAQRTGIDVARCGQYMQRLYDNGIYVDGCWYADEGFPDDEDLTRIQIVMWAMCVEGTVVCCSGMERMAECAKEQHVSIEAPEQAIDDEDAGLSTYEQYLKRAGLNPSSGSVE